jgi:hypothetical protein
LRNCSIPSSGKRLFVYKMSRLALRFTQPPIFLRAEQFTPPYVHVVFRGKALFTLCINTDICCYGSQNLWYGSICGRIFMIVCSLSSAFVFLWAWFDGSCIIY